MKGSSTREDEDAWLVSGLLVHDPVPSINHCAIEGCVGWRFEANLRVVARAVKLVQEALALLVQASRVDRL